MTSEVRGPWTRALRRRRCSACWTRTGERSSVTYPLLLSTEADGTRHEAVFDHLDQVLKRGQEYGEFARGLPTTWPATAIVALGHAAGGEVTAGRLALPDASEALARSALRVCGAGPTTVDDLVERHGGAGGP
jgi:hypothetical protein